MKGETSLGGIKILNGKYKGAEIALNPEQELLIGRDVHFCQFVIESSWVSRIHVKIQYDDKKNCYKITDQSKHGTFDADKKKLPNGETVEFDKNSILNIGLDGIQILLM